MAKINILGIYREKRFSPGKIRQDAAILDAALACIPDMKFTVDTLQAEELSDMTAKPDLVLSMAQSGSALDRLDRWEKKATTIINSAQSVRNCYRKSLIRRLQAADIPIPPSRIVHRNALKKVLDPLSGSGCWLKRGDVHAMQSDDVVKVETEKQLDRALVHFRRRRIEEVLVQQHVDGKVIKFYGVGRGAFFYACFVDSGKVVQTGAGTLQDLAVRAAGAVELEIYGGDAVQTPKGSIVLIDLNDWPSFSPCCAAAARGIAGYIEKYR
jgi:glutathione synthase/RimK-type ligase-like ATP-grasp enzyme